MRFSNTGPVPGQAIRETLNRAALLNAFESQLPLFASPIAK